MTGVGEFIRAIDALALELVLFFSVVETSQTSFDCFFDGGRL